MKFKFAFKVHSDIFSTGTRYLTEMQGLVNVKVSYNTLAFKFEWEESPVWKYIPSTALITGWNSVSVDGDNTYIKLTVNSSVFTVIDGLFHIDTKYYSGVSSSTGTLTIPISDFSINDTYVIETTYETMDDFTVYAGHNQTSLGFRTSNGAGIGFYAENGSNYLKAWDTLSSAQVPTTVPNFWFASTQYKFKTTLHNNTIILYRVLNDTETKLIEYTFQTNFDFNNVNFGNGGAGTYCSTAKYNITATKIYKNGVEIMNGQTAVKGVDYLVGAGITEQIDEYYPTPYPSIKTGSLITHQSWLYLKDIQALKLEDEL